MQFAKRDIGGPRTDIRQPEEWSGPGRLTLAAIALEGRDDKGATDENRDPDMEDRAPP